MEEAGGVRSVAPLFQRLLGGLSGDEGHHVDLVEDESEGEVVGTQVRYEGHHVDLVEGEGEGVDEMVGTQVRCVW